MGSVSAFDGILRYPVARRDDSVVDNYHGVDVPDPYRWLEDPDSSETKEFVEKQMKVTDSVLQTCETREKLREKLTKLFDFPKYNAPFRAGEKYFYFHNTGLQPQTVLYVEVYCQDFSLLDFLECDCVPGMFENSSLLLLQDSLEGEREVLLDPNTLSDDGTVALSEFTVSEDAKYFAYGTSSSGSDWVTIEVLRIDDKSSEPDVISWVLVGHMIARVFSTVVIQLLRMERT